MSSKPEGAIVLIVEDDVPTQKLLQAVLRREGLRSEVAGNGGEAIEALRLQPFAAVVLDMMMPSFSGHDVVQFLSSTADPPPVVVCSAAGARALDGLDPNVVKAVVRKPFDIEDLTNAIRAAVEGTGDR